MEEEEGGWRNGDVVDEEEEEIEGMKGDGGDADGGGSSSGIRLGDIPNVKYMLSGRTKSGAEELKVLHKLLFGSIGKETTRKRKIRDFSGFSWEDGSVEEKKMREKMLKLTGDQLKAICMVLDLPNRGNKDSMVSLSLNLLKKPYVNTRRRDRKSVDAQMKRRNRTRKKRREANEDFEEEEEEEEVENSPRTGKMSTSDSKSDAPLVGGQKAGRTLKPEIDPAKKVPDDQLRAKVKKIISEGDLTKLSVTYVAKPKMLDNVV